MLWRYNVIHSPIEHHHVHICWKKEVEEGGLVMSSNQSTALPLSQNAVESLLEHVSYHVTSP